MENFLKSLKQQPHSIFPWPTSLSYLFLVHISLSNALFSFTYNNFHKKFEVEEQNLRVFSFGKLRKTMKNVREYRLVHRW